MKNFIEVINSAPSEEPARQFYFIDMLKLWYDEQTKKLGRELTANIQTLGCQMNARDSEKIEGILRQIGYEITEDLKADFVIYNTCTVRENANLKVYGSGCYASFQNCYNLKYVNNFPSEISSI